MTLPPPIRKLILAVHLLVSVGWIGAAVAYLALALAVRIEAEATTTRSGWMAMEVIGWWVLVPLSIGTMITGVLLAICTSWGLFGHYWVVISLSLTTLATAVLWLHMPDVSDQAAAAKVADAEDLEALGSDLFHSGLGLLVLVAILVLNVYKPRGLTRYGWRKQQERRQSSAAAP